MRKLILLVCLCCACVVSAQTVTQRQRQQALSKATEFCRLLAAYSSGGEKCLTNDALIYDLCSSQNISTYDDLDGNCDNLLVSYLFTILRDYDNKLPMSFSPLEIEDVFGIPEIKYTSMNVSGEAFKAVIVGYKDTFITLASTQTMQTLGITTNRKIIYSCKEDKIVSFSTGSSPYILYNKVIKAYAAEEFPAVYYFADKVLAVKRCDFSLKKTAGSIAEIAALRELNLEAIEKYASFQGSNSTFPPGYLEYVKGYIHTTRQNFKEAARYFSLSAAKDFASANVLLGLIYGHPDCGLQNREKAERYFKIAMQSDDVLASGMSAYWYYIVSRSNPELVPLSSRKQLELLKFASERKFAPAYLPLSALYESLGKPDSSAIWSEDAAFAGSGVGYARVGKYLLQCDQKYHATGLKYLKKALERDVDTELQKLKDEIGIVFAFPKNKAEVRELLRRY